MTSFTCRAARWPDPSHPVPFCYARFNALDLSFQQSSDGNFTACPDAPLSCPNCWKLQMQTNNAYKTKPKKLNAICLGTTTAAQRDKSRGSYPFAYPNIIVNE